MQEYADYLKGKVYSPREYVEHQLHMSDEEKQARTEFFTKLFEDHDRKKAEVGNKA